MAMLNNQMVPKKILKSTRSWGPTVAKNKSGGARAHHQLCLLGGRLVGGWSSIEIPTRNPGRVMVFFHFSICVLGEGIICSFQHEVYIVLEGYISGSLLQLSNFRRALSGWLLLAARAVCPHRQWLALSDSSKTEWPNLGDPKKCDSNLSNQRRAPHTNKVPHKAQGGSFRIGIL